MRLPSRSGAAFWSALVLLLTGCTTPTTHLESQAVKGQLADVGSTAVALSVGAAEANPLGLALLPAKFALHRYVKTLPEADQPEAWAAVGAVGWGATANNVCVTVGILSGGIGSVFVCPLLGVFAGVMNWRASADEREAVAVGEGE